MIKRSKSVVGLTLVEVLVVVAVIGLLFVMVMPAISPGPKRGNQLVCMSHLRQINLAVLLYAGEFQDALPPVRTPANTQNPFAIYAGYKTFIKAYYRPPDPTTAQNNIFACPSDSFYPAYITTNTSPPPAWQYVRNSLHDQSMFDFSSYAFNAGGYATRTSGTNTPSRPGLCGVKLSAVRQPARTLLVTEASALAPWSWHRPSPELQFNNATNLAGFVDGHVMHLKIYWDNRPLPGGGLAFACDYNPPAGYDYQWSAN